MTDRQMFKLVDANTVPSKNGSCGCGCGGEGKKARAEQAVGYLELKPLYLRAPQAERERLAKGLKV